jgi:hypothetical protein
MDKTEVICTCRKYFLQDINTDLGLNYEMYIVFSLICHYLQVAIKDS